MKVKIVNCPVCGQPVEWSAEKSPFRPFCSERCRLIDLGDWASENHAIPGEPVPPEMIDEEDKNSR